MASPTASAISRVTIPVIVAASGVPHAPRLSGWGGRGDDIDMVTLTYGPREHRPAPLSITTYRHGVPDPERTLRSTYRTAWTIERTYREYDRAGGADEPHRGEHDRRSGRAASRASRRTVAVKLDDHPAQLDVLGIRKVWTALLVQRRAEVPTALIVAHGTAAEALAFGTVTDLRAYLPLPQVSRQLPVGAELVFEVLDDNGEWVQSE